MAAFLSVETSERKIMWRVLWVGELRNVPWAMPREGRGGESLEREVSDAEEGSESDLDLRTSMNEENVEHLRDSMGVEFVSVSSKTMSENTDF